MGLDVKQVVVVLRRPPGKDSRLAEGLRNALGLAVERDLDLVVFLVGDAARWFAPAREMPEEFRRPLEALGSLRRRIVAEAEALAEADAGGGAGAGAGLEGPSGKVQVAPRTQIFDEISEAAAVVVW